MPLPHPMFDQLVPQQCWDGYPAATGTALWFHDTFLGIPGALDLDRAVREIDIVPAQGQKLAQPQTCI